MTEATRKNEEADSSTAATAIPQYSTAGWRIQISSLAILNKGD